MIRKAIPLVVLAALLLTPGALSQTAPPTLPLTIVTETQTTLTLGWSEVPGATGYRFSSSQANTRPHTWNGQATTVRFLKGAEWYRVEALMPGPFGEFPPPDPPPPPPPPVQDCLVSNAETWTPESCEYGTLITRTNQAWECTRPIREYGALPIKVIVHSTTNWDSGWGASAGNGCVGDGNADTVDLLVFVEGDGRTVGPRQDAFKTRGAADGPRGIQISGRVECGLVSAGAHQDMVQLQGGTDVTFVNFTSGNWNAGTSTCRGAGGVIYTNPGTNIDFIRSFMVGCNHGIVASGSLPNHDWIDGGSRSGRTDGTDPMCGNTGGGSHPCGAGPRYVRTICEQWIGGRWVERPR